MREPQISTRFDMSGAHKEHCRYLQLFQNGPSDRRVACESIVEGEYDWALAIAGDRTNAVVNFVRMNNVEPSFQIPHLTSKSPPIHGLTPDFRVLLSQDAMIHQHHGVRSR